jgi:hypothetical protein
VLVCERDGFVMGGTNDDEPVATVEDHIADAHPDLPRKLSRADLLAEIRANANDE